MVRLSVFSPSVRTHPRSAIWLALDPRFDLFEERPHGLLDGICHGAVAQLVRAGDS